MELVAIYRTISPLFRRRRMKRFYRLFRPSAQTRLLDIGGLPHTWTTEGGEAGFPVTLVNLRFPNREDAGAGRFTAVEGDAAHLPFIDGSFDIVFSNSVIEHMETWERQQAFAAEARRVAARLWIQTPARSFPLEPHFLAPFFHFLPRRIQSRLARRFTLWGLLTRPGPAQVEKVLSEIRLLTLRELRQLFPDCAILRERFMGLTKSYVVVRGIGQTA